MPIDELQHVLLHPDDVLQQPDPLFGRPIANVIARHVAQQRHEHGVVIFHRRVQRRFRRLNCAAEPAPEVEFPGQIETEVPLTEERIAHAEPRVSAVGRLQLREEAADRKGELCPRGQNSEPGLAQRQILLIRLLNEPVERRVVELFPPVGEVIRFTIPPHPRVARLDPLLGHRRRWPTIIRTDLEPIAHVLERPGATRRLQRERC